MYTKYNAVKRVMFMSSDPILSMQWPDGIHALPMPKINAWGCPFANCIQLDGLASGHRYQDTENSHNNNCFTGRIWDKMRVYVRSNLCVDYCVKTFHENGCFQWPKGTTVWRKGVPGPGGFAQCGMMKIFYNNKDRNCMSELPNGRYARDTQVH